MLMLLMFNLLVRYAIEDKDWCHASVPPSIQLLLDLVGEGDGQAAHCHLERLRSLMQQLCEPVETVDTDACVSEGRELLGVDEVAFLEEFAKVSNGHFFLLLLFVVCIID